MFLAASETGRKATAHRSIPASVPSGTFRQSLLVLTLLGACLPQVQAVIPNGTTATSLYNQGYLDVTRYTSANGTPTSQWVTKGDTTNSTTITRTTAGLNQAIKDAYAANLALYFPSGTYVVNDTLKAYTATGVADGNGSLFTVPRNHLVLIGSTSGARPKIKLVPKFGDVTFDSTTTPKPVLEFMNFVVDSFTNFVPNLTWDPATDEDASTGFFQMLRGIDIDCGPNVGAIGLYFNQAQNSSIENVKITATGAHTGIRGLPSRGWGAVNVEIEGGQYGIDTKGLGNPGAGTVIAGAIFRNQTVTAVRHTDFVPMVIVGFEITTFTTTQAAVTIEPSFSLGSSNLALIDGKITLAGSPTSAAIDNTAGKSIYVRNVHVWGPDNLNLIKSGGVTHSSNGPGSTSFWRRINEYSYRDEFLNEKVDDWQLDLTTSDPDDRIKIPRIAQTFIAGAIGSPPQLPPSVDTGAAPLDLVTRHRWLALPSADDPDVVDVTKAAALGTGLQNIMPGQTDGDGTLVDAGHLQAIINAHRKVFLPKGIYRLKSPGITLHADTILFGAARSLTRIEADPSWTIDKETPIIQTDPNADATTYLGDLTIGVKTDVLASDYFTALNWKAGRSSMVHMGQPYRFPYDGNIKSTQDHSLLKIEGTGGGRWYFAGSIKTGHAQNSGYRILEVTGTRQPLWFYGLNLEHAVGCATFSEFNDAQNIRIYGVKSEFQNNGSPPLTENTMVLYFWNVKNVALFGHGAIRNAVKNHGCIEFNGDSNDVLAALISPQNNRDGSDLTVSDHTLRENWSASSPQIKGVAYPNCVALFKRGTITDAAMTAHIAPFYGPEVVFTSIAAEDGWVREGATAGQGGTFDAAGAGAFALRVGDEVGSGNKQYKSILSFNTSTSPIPESAVILVATLELRRSGLDGNVTALGALRASIRTGYFGSSSSLENADFEAGATFSNVVQGFNIPSTNGDWAVGSLNSAGVSAINRNGQTQFRVFFATATNGNDTADILRFYSGENATANRPVLWVRYTQP